MNCLFQRPQLLPLCLLLLLFLLLHSSPARAYITSYHAVPAQRQIRWLKSLTVELTESTPVGKLSQRDVFAAGELMYAWSHTQHQGGIEHAKACEALIKRIIDEQRAAAAAATSTSMNQQDSLQLTVNEYNYVLECWARSGAGVPAAERCEAILTTMQQQGGLVQPNLSSFKAVLMAWRQCGSSSDKERTKISKSSTTDDNDDDVSSSAAARAQRFLEYMIQLYIQHENELALPDSDCFDIVLQIWSRSGHVEAPQKAERLLMAMERLYKSTNSIKLKPQTTSFNAVLAAWSKSSHPQAAQRATDVLAFMELLSSTHGDEMVQPGTGSYNIVMGCLARHADQAVAAKKADAVLKLAEKQAASQQQQRQQKGTKSSASSSSQLVLDTILFNTAMGCWAKSNIPGAFRRARSILDRQVKLYKDGCHSSCRPDVFGYTSVLGSCASESSSNPKQRLEAFHVAMATYRELQQVDTPNHVSYGIMLKACSRLLPSSSPSQRRRQDELASEIFQDAINAGCVGDLVLAKLRDSVSSAQVYHELLQGHYRNKLPRAWTINVRERNDTGRSKKHNHNINNNNNKKHRRRAEV